MEKDDFIKTDDAIKVGLRIKLLREAIGISIRELGRRANLTEGYLSQLENGKRAPSLSSMRKISDALGVDPALFLEDKLKEVELIFKAARNLSPESQKAVAAFIQFLLKEEKKR